MVELTNFGEFALVDFYRIRGQIDLPSRSAIFVISVRVLFLRHQMKITIAVLAAIILALAVCAQAFSIHGLGCDVCKVETEATLNLVFNTFACKEKDKVELLCSVCFIYVPRLRIIVISSHVLIFRKLLPLASAKM